MVSFSKYVEEEIQHSMNENTSQIGLTDVFSGSPVMGPHHHEYWIYDETGYGRTSDSINEPSNINAETPITTVGGHIHFINNGVVQPAGDGHTHKLLPPQKVDADTKIFSHKCKDGQCCCGDTVETPIRGI
jgi:hypothetical protein